jgi:hypothetical protein
MIQKLFSLFPTKRVLAALCIFLMGQSLVTPASAQVDPGEYQIYQGGVVVGIIYVPERGPDPTIYAEYWVLSSHYIYPSAKTMVATEIVPMATNPYTSLTDFIMRVPWAEGYRFVTVIAKDRATLPVVPSTAGSTASR